MCEPIHGRVATVGMFDGVHLGHRHLLAQLRQSKGTSEKPRVFTFSTHPLALLRPGLRPQMLQTVDDRVAMIAAEGCDPVVLDFTPELASLKAADFMAMLRDRYGVDALLLGFNNRFGSDRLQSLEDYRTVANAVGVEVFRAEEYPVATVSSSAIRNEIARGEVARAADMLGRPHAISGTVLPGRHVGSEIGFPTANLDPSQSPVIVPAPGVYVCDAVVEGDDRYRSIVNIGKRPTVDKSAEAPLKTEAHLIGFSGNLYGGNLRLDFLERLRDERSFPSLDALKEQLEADRTAALSLKF